MLRRYDPNDSAGYGASLERELEREIEREEQRRVPERLEAIERLLAQQVKGPEPEPERRRDMSPKRKSDLISELGLAKYQQLPW